MGNGPGVSAAALGDGRWRVRWRERGRQRERVVHSEEAAIELRATILRALETTGSYAPVEAPPPPATLDAVLGAWLRTRLARGGAASTLRGATGAVNRLLRAARRGRGLSKEVPVPGDVLTRSGVVEIIEALRATGLAAITLRPTVEVLLEAWEWAHDDGLPGVGSPPRDRRSLLPGRDPYAATLAPSLAEIDAVIVRLARREVPAPVALRLAVIASRTGLRASQVLGLRWDDVMPAGSGAAGAVSVRVGKSARERAERRTVPLSPSLAAWLEARRAAGSEPVIRRRSDNRGVRGGGAWDTLSETWAAAVAAGEVRREVWAPEDRRIARPSHAFRAAFQGHLVEAGVRDEVIDALVGHQGGLRARHYVGADSRWKAMVEAVALLPPLPAEVLA